MKTFCALIGACLLLALVSGCEVTPGYGYAGASYGVYGEYPSTYAGEYYSYPAYPYYYSYGHRRAPYDRDHYWDRGYYWDRHGYDYGHNYGHRYDYGRHDRDDRRHH